MPSISRPRSRRRGSPACSSSPGCGGELGSLDPVSRIVKVFGMVNCAPGFNNTPAVVDGCSKLLLDVFGDERGRHARSAVGQAELPFDIAVEIEMVVEVSA